jgi:hypothetical protein
MALAIINRIYTDQRGRTGEALKGNTLDPATVQYDVEYNTKLDLSVFYSVIKEGARFTLTSGTWEDLIGAYNGANIDFTLSGTTITTTITWVDGSEMVLANGGGTADDIKTDGSFEVTDAPELFEVYYNLVQNTLSGTVYSMIDNETNRFDVVLVNALTVGGGTDNFVQKGKKSGGSVITATIARTADVGGYKRYSIIIDFRLWTIFKPDAFKARDCVGDYALIRATPDCGNENVFIEVASKRNGNTGFQDESFNGGTADYILMSIVWSDANANIMGALDPSQPSTFTLDILGTFAATDQYNVKLYRLAADASEYSNLALPMENNISLCTSAVLIDDGVATALTGYIAAGGEAFDIAGFEVSNNGTSITVEGTVTTSAQMAELIEAKPLGDKRYVLEIVCESNTLTYKTANTVNVLCDFQDAVKNIIPLGNYANLATLEMLAIDSTVYAASPDLLIESNNRASATFTLPKDSNRDNPWISLTGRITAEKTTGETFQFESFTYDISNLIPIKDGTLVIDYSQTRGKKLPSTSLFNVVSFERNGALDTGLDFGITMNYGFQVGFETWQSEPQVSPDFADKTNNWYTISSDAQWQLKFELVIEHEDGSYTDSLDFGILNYNAWTGTSVFTFEDLSAVSVTKPLANEITKITSTNTATAPWVGNEIGVISVRDVDGNVTHQISTLEDPIEDGNPLIPIAGETRLKKTVAGNDIILECYLDIRILGTNRVTTPITLLAEIKGDV